MKQMSTFGACLLITILISILAKSVECLLFSQFTLYQIVFAVSWPIPYKNPLRKLFFNIGFQFNYQEPFQLSSFYKPSNFQNAFGTRNFDQSNGTNAAETQEDNTTGTVDMQSGNVTTLAILETDEHNETMAATQRIQTRSSNDMHTNGYADRDGELIGKDLTAAQFYESVEDHLSIGGYDRMCLLKSICELARHPLHQDEEEHLVADVITFLLTPSQHNAFAFNENYEREKYVAAELVGRQGGNCDEIYSECEYSFLNHISYVSAANDFM